MVPVNGKRPIVELVMMQGGKYQPIKFSNNMQVCIIIKYLVPVLDKIKGFSTSS
jgi:hypothetical protein